MKNELVFGLGPAGTGKTYLAVALAVSMMLEGKIDKIILSRPAVEAGENLGFLPGDLKDKVDPYLRPLYDALYEMLPAEQVDKKLAIGEIEIAPLAFMRGRTLSNAFVILDEAQNTTPMQMKMFLTRLGENSRMVVNGDLSQVDLPRGVISGLKDALDTLENVSSISSVTFSANDVVRHGLVAKIVKAYEEKGKNNTAMTKTNLTITLNEPGWEEQIPNLQQLANDVLVNALEYVEANEDIDFLGTENRSTSTSVSVTTTKSIRSTVISAAWTNRPTSFPLQPLTIPTLTETRNFSAKSNSATSSLRSKPCSVKRPTREFRCATISATCLPTAFCIFSVSTTSKTTRRNIWKNSKSTYSNA